MRAMAAPCWDPERGKAPALPQDDLVTGVLRRLWVREQMKERLTETCAAFRGDEIITLNQSAEEKCIRSTIEDLQKSKEEIEVPLWNKTMALQRIQLMAALRKKIRQDGQDSCSVLETVNHIVLLSRTIIKYQQLAREKKQKLIDIKRKRRSLKKDQRRKLQHIQAAKKKQKEKGIMNLDEAKMLNKLEKERMMTALIQNAFQKVLIGSRVNWAKDPSLKAIALQLETNAHLS